MTLEPWDLTVMSQCAGRISIKAVNALRKMKVAAKKAVKKAAKKAAPKAAPKKAAKKAAKRKPNAAFMAAHAVSAELAAVVGGAGRRRRGWKR